LYTAEVELRGSALGLRAAWGDPRSPSFFSMLKSRRRIDTGRMGDERCWGELWGPIEEPRRGEPWMPSLVGLRARGGSETCRRRSVSIAVGSMTLPARAISV
jgi:hypothetical protein